MIQTCYEPDEIPCLLSAPGTNHQLVSLKIAAALLGHVEPGNLGHVLQAPCNVIFSRGLIIQPDIFFVERGRCGLIEKHSLRGSPDVIIEIMAEDTHEDDLAIKRKMYSRFEVKEYWIADLQFETIEVLLWSELGYSSAGVYGKSDRLSSPALPGFKLPLRRVFTNPV